jgi:predicted nucleic acid-binding protein
MRVLLDTDVVLDFLLACEPFAAAARALFMLIARGACVGYVCGITPINVFYLARKDKDGIEAKQVIGKLLSLVQICEVNRAILEAALALPFSDYEDATQHACAVASGLDAIVTRNLDDYKNATLPVFSPTDFLNYLQSQQP